MATSVFYSIIRNFNYFTLKGGLLFLPCKLCICTEHGVVYYHFGHWVNARKTSGQPNINELHYCDENVTKQLVHESAVRSSR